MPPHRIPVLFGSLLSLLTLRCQEPRAGAPHLPTLTACGKSSGYLIARLSDGGSSDGAPPACSADSDCVGGYTMDTGATVDGKCVAGTCDFDQCFSDTDCPSQQACVCMSDTHAPGNVCEPAQCRVDADCGPPGLCSESLSAAGPFYGVVGRYCRTLADTCATDADCAGSADQGAGTCVYMQTVGHWACSWEHIAG